MLNFKKSKIFIWTSSRIHVRKMCKEAKILAYIMYYWMLKSKENEIFFKEALLHRQSKQRRIAVSEGYNYRAPAYPRCIYIGDNSVKCSDRAIPLSKFCKKRILVQLFKDGTTLSYTCNKINAFTVIPKNSRFYWILLMYFRISTRK